MVLEKFTDSDQKSEPHICVCVGTIISCMCKSLFVLKQFCSMR